MVGDMQGIEWKHKSNAEILNDIMQVGRGNNSLYWLVDWLYLVDEEY